jgi:hypothetical protein
MGDDFDHRVGVGIPCKNVIAVLKRFKIVANCYSNRRKRFGLRFFLIAAIYNGKLRLA